MTRLIIAALVAACAIAPAVAAPDKPRALGVNARIAFADSTGIRSYQPDGDDALWIEGQRGEWYRAEFVGPCFDLPYASAIGFITRGGGTLDRFSQIKVGDRICQLNKLVTSAPPPGRKVKTEG